MAKYITDKQRHSSCSDSIVELYDTAS